MRAGNRLTIISASLLFVGLAWMISREVHFSGWVDDDAFISFRYARNWAQGNGLVFNPGERVEGYTNFLWTAFLTIASTLDLDLPSTARVLGGAFSILTVLALFGARSSGILQQQESGAGITSSPAVVVLIAPLALCLSESWAAWAVGGLENVFSGFLIAISWLRHRWMMFYCSGPGLVIIVVLEICIRQPYLLLKIIRGNFRNSMRRCWLCRALGLLQPAQFWRRPWGSVTLFLMVM